MAYLSQSTPYVIWLFSTKECGGTGKIGDWASDLLHAKTLTAFQNLLRASRPREARLEVSFRLPFDRLSRFWIFITSVGTIYAGSRKITNRVIEILQVVIFSKGDNVFISIFRSFKKEIFWAFLFPIEGRNTLFSMDCNMQMIKAWHKLTEGDKQRTVV